MMMTIVSRPVGTVAKVKTRSTERSPSTAGQALGKKRAEEWSPWESVHGASESGSRGDRQLTDAWASDLGLEDWYKRVRLTDM